MSYSYQSGSLADGLGCDRRVQEKEVLSLQ